MPSDITISQLTAASGGVGQIPLSATPLSPAGMACLPYMQHAKVQFWVATSNNRNTATLLAESDVGFTVHGGLGVSVTRYYWARAVDPEGNFGPFFPASATGGIAATTSNQVPPANSVGTPQLQDGAVTTQKIPNLAITNAKIQSLEAGKITAGTLQAGVVYSGTVIAGQISAESLSAISANLGNITAGTITGTVIQTSLSAPRIVLNGSNSYIQAVNTGTPSVVATFGVGGLDNSYIAAIGNTNVAVARFTNQSGGGWALHAAGRTIMDLTSVNFHVLDVVHNGNFSGAHGIRARNAFAGGGDGYVGLSAQIGGYAFLANVGAVYSAAGYLPFTGMHPGLILKDDEAVPGDIVVDVRVLARDGVSNTLTEVRRSSSRAERGVIGVVEKRAPYHEDALLNVNLGPIHRRHFVKKYDLATINALGEGQVNVCGLGGNIEVGDFICTSDMPGKGQRQTVIETKRGKQAMEKADDTPRSFTVARARESVRFSSPTDVKMVSCIYVSG